MNAEAQRASPFVDAYPGSLMLYIFVLVVLPPTLAFVLYVRHVHDRPARHRSATVLVLGDVGRSPRMMYHAESLAKAGWDTYLVGYGAPIPALLETPLVHLLHLHNPPTPLLRLPWVLRAPIRVASQVLSVLYLCLVKVPIRTEVLLVQNPPSIPTLALAQLICAMSGTKLIIDWHNTGYSILAMRVGAASPLVRIAIWFERKYGQRAYAHLFVTQALRDFLTETWSLQGIKAVLHDRPPQHFGRTEPLMQHELFQRIAPILQPPLPPRLASDDSALTCRTAVVKGMPRLRPDRPALLVSSTSWTADEDFSLLLDALDRYQAAKAGGADIPALVVLVTGIGALRAAFEAEVARREAVVDVRDNTQGHGGPWTDVVVRCVFLPARDYPLLLGCADVGVSLHQSSSGRDLPMKVVDMFGCGVPVLARHFECIGELVKDGVNGRVFASGAQLGEQLIETLGGFPEATELARLRSYFDSASGRSTPRRGSLHTPGHELEWTTWDQNWDDVMRRGVLDFRAHR